MGKLVTIYCSIIQESKNTGAIQPGDAIMSVNNFTLLADEQQSPGGQAHVNACAQVMGNASHPRRIRFYRSKNINKDQDTSELPANEAMQIIPVIFNSGDGSAQLMEALQSVSFDDNSSMAPSRASLNYNAPPSPPVTSPAQTMTKQQSPPQQPQLRQSQQPQPSNNATAPSLLRDPSTGLLKKTAAKNPFAPGTNNRPPMTHPLYVTHTFNTTYPFTAKCSSILVLPVLSMTHFLTI